MATEEDLVNVITNFGQNFQEDGFVVFDSKAAINFMGSILINYKGLRLIKFRKSQLMPQEFAEMGFNDLCDQILSGPNKR